MRLLVHLCYSGLSGSSVVGCSLAAQRYTDMRQVVVFWGYEQVSGDVIEKLEEQGVVWYFQQKRKGLDIKALYRITKLLRDLVSGDDDAVCIFHGVQMLPVLALFRISSHRTDTCGFLHGPMAEFSGLGRQKTFWYSMLCSKLICVSDEVSAGLRGLPGGSVFSKKAITIYNGVDTGFWKRSCPDRRDESDLLRFCFCGTLTP